MANPLVAIGLVTVLVLVGAALTVAVFGLARRALRRRRERTGTGG